MKILINSFPKSGTHLAMQMAEALAQRREPTPWMDCFDLGGWGTRFEDLDATVRQIRSQPDGTWMVGHVGYRPEIAEALRKAGTAVLFVHRDLRDVAVSQVRHIEDPDEERFRHPGKILYMSLGSFEERLRAVIEGLDHYLGIFERWALFAPWLEQGWILPLRYEEMIDEPDATARRFMNYVINHSGSISADGGTVSWSEYERGVRAVLQGLQERDGPTFREGRASSWREAFSLEMERLFVGQGSALWTADNAHYQSPSPTLLALSLAPPTGWRS